MLNNKFFNLYKTLNQSEYIAFGEHLAATFGAAQQIIKMYTHIARYYPNLKKRATKLTHQAIHSAVFSNERFEPMKILNLYSDLHQQLKIFLVRKTLAQNKFETQRHWLNVLSDKNIHDRFLKESAHLYTLLDAVDQKGSDYYHKMLIAQDIQYNLIEPLKKDHNPDAPLTYLQCLDVYYAICKLKVGCDMATLNYMASSGKDLPERFDLSAIVQLSTQLNSKVLSEYPLLHLYYAAFKMLTLREEPYFRQLLSLFKEHIAHIETADLRRILTFLQNHIALQLKSGKSEYWSESFNLIQFAFKHGVYSKYGAISPTLFQNIVTIACNNKDFEWAAHFIRQQGEYLDEASRQDTILLAEAGLDIETGYYDAARQKLDGKSEFKDPQHTIRVSMMLLFCDYMRKVDESTLADRCNNFERLLIRIRKKYKINIQSYQKFSHILKMFLFKKDTAAQIRRTMSSLGSITGRSWLENILEHYKPYR